MEGTDHINRMVRCQVTDLVDEGQEEEMDEAGEEVKSQVRADRHELLQEGKEMLFLM